MSSPSVLPLLLLFAVASAGPLDLPEETTPGTTLLPPSLAAAAAAAAAATSTLAPAAAPVEERAVPAATLAPSADGQHCMVAGVVFHNGARLPASADPDPCRACYCQGGEPVCTRVHCYRRPDCAPRHVPGSCCPKYDSCPPVQDERSPEPRIRDASTQTDVEPTAPTTASEVTSDGPEANNTVTVTEWMETTETSTATTSTSVTDLTSTQPTVTGSTATVTSPEPTSSATDWEGDDSSEETPATSAYPPGIDLYPLHEHLPFLSPGDANGPNT